MVSLMIRVDVNARRKASSPTYRTSEEIHEGHKKYAHLKITKMANGMLGRGQHDDWLPEEDTRSLTKVFMHVWHSLIARYGMSEVNAANSLEADTARILRGDYMDLGSNRVAVWSV